MMSPGKGETQKEEKEGGKQRLLNPDLNRLRLENAADDDAQPTCLTFPLFRFSPNPFGLFPKD